MNYVNKSWQIVLTRKATKDLKNLDPVQRSRVIRRIDQLEHTANPLDIAKWLDGNLKGSLSTRVGEIRVIFIIHNASSEIEIQRVQYRGEDYK
ncbi:MAG: hypothetical protein EBZ87_03480 [Microbacteriaceae bacterium]|nr:hypothetical protein [Microbacteriaceae bacterium]